MIYCLPTYFDCIEKVAERAASFGVSLDSRVLIFCEDKLSLSLEKALVEKAGGAFGAEVTSFGRYISKHLSGRKTLSKEGAAMAVKKIISSLTDLRALGRTGSSPALAVKTAELIAQLKSARITPDMLFDCVPDCPPGMAGKINDVALIFKAYEDFLLTEGLTDSSNCLSEMLPLLENDSEIKNAHVIIAGYSSVTKQSCEVIKKLYSISKGCDFFAITGNNKDLYTDELLSFLKSFIFSEPVYLSSSAEDEALHLLDRLYCPEKFNKVGLYSDKLHIFEGTSISDEVKFICADIKNKIINNGYKYSDFAIGVGNLSDYELTFSRELSSYGIPFFADKKRSLISHPLACLVNSAVKSAIKRLNLNDVKAVVKNSLFIPEKRLSDKMIRLMIENSVTPSSFVRDGSFIPEGGDGDEATDSLILMRKWEILSSFMNSFPQKATASQFVDKVSAFIQGAVGSLDHNEKSSSVYLLSKRLSELGANEERSFLISSIDDFTSVLTEIKDILGNEMLKADEFLKLLIAGEEASEVSILPEYLDAVYLSDLKNVRSKKYSALYLAGLSGDVPPVKADTALLLDSDIAKLDALSVSVEPKIRVVNRREKEACALAFACFKDSITISYSLSSAKGNATARSEIVDYVINAFSNNEKAPAVITRESLSKKQPDDLDNDERSSLDFLALRPAMLSLLKLSDEYKNGGTSSLLEASSFYEAIKDNEELKLTADKLVGLINEGQKIKTNFPIENYFSDARVSASVLETYYKCPYKCFIGYGLGVKDSLRSDIRSLDFGNILHTIAEIFLDSLEEMKSEADCIKKADEIFNGIFNDPSYSRFLKRPDYEYSTFLTRKEAHKLCITLYLEHLSSSFKTVGREVWFADWGEYKSFPLRTKRGRYKLFGKADRVDKYGDYIRIIDYKTGNAESKGTDTNFYAGLYMQLYLYMNAFTQDGSKPAGAYYYAIKDDFSREDDEPVSMYGKTLNEEEVFVATDNNFESCDEYNSKIVKLKKKNTKTKGVTVSGNTTDEQTLKAYMLYARLLAEKAVDEIADGVTLPSPYKGVCDYCEYGSICGRDNETGLKQRSVSRVTSDDIKNAAENTEKSLHGGENNG